jgi:hypothetical protein
MTWLNEDHIFRPRIQTQADVKSSAPPIGCFDFIPMAESLVSEPLGYPRFQYSRVLG